MADIELVVKIPMELYNLIQNKLDFNGDLKREDIKTLMLAVDDGKPSPDDEIKAGDEVRRIGSDPERDDCDFGICLMNNSKIIYVMRADGSTGEEDRKNWYRTGRHFDQIEEVLKAMRE